MEHGTDRSALFTDGRFEALDAMCQKLFWKNWLSLSGSWESCEEEDIETSSHDLGAGLC